MRKLLYIGLSVAQALTLSGKLTISIKFGIKKGPKISMQINVRLNFNCSVVFKRKNTRAIKTYINR